MCVCVLMSRTRTFLGRSFLALSAISLVVGIATGAWDTVPLAVLGLAGGLLILSVRNQPDPERPRVNGRQVAARLGVGIISLTATVIASQTPAAPFVLPVLLVAVCAAIGYQQLRRA